jgi:hypothetical protein
MDRYSPHISNGQGVNAVMSQFYGTTLESSVRKLVQSDPSVRVDVIDSLHGGLRIGRHVELARLVGVDLNCIAWCCHECKASGRLDLTQIRGEEWLTQELAFLMRGHRHEPVPLILGESKPTGKLYPWEE